MAVNQDELLAQMYDQMTRRGGNRSPALARMQNLDPAINPPPPPRNVTPAALTAKPARPGALPAGRQGGRAPMPAIRSPRPAPKPTTVQPGLTHVGRAGMPAQVLRAGAGRGAAAAAPLTPPTSPLAPAVQAKKAPAGYFAEAPTGRANYVTDQNAVLPPPGPAAPVPAETAAALNPGKIVQKGRRSFSAPDDAGTVTLGDARALDIGKKGGGISVIGMGLSPEATVAKLKDQTEQARQLNRMKSTGLSEQELAKVDARRAKDSEIHQLTQSGISPEQAAGAIFNRERALAERTAETPGQSALNQQALLTGEQGLQKGALELEKGGAELQQEQEFAGVLDKLASLNDENDPGGKQRSALKEQALLIKNKYVQPVAQKALGYGALADPSGINPPTIYNKDTGQIGGAGAPAAGAPPQEHIAMLVSDPSGAAEFDELYGPGSAAQYLNKK